VPESLGDRFHGIAGATSGIVRSGQGAGDRRAARKRLI
jgi:hypothetical protein